MKTARVIPQGGEVRKNPDQSGFWSQLHKNYTKGIKKASRKTTEPLISLSAEDRNRTSDTRIFSPLLYRLSYLGISAILTVIVSIVKPFVRVKKGAAMFYAFLKTSWSPASLRGALLTPEKGVK